MSKFPKGAAQILTEKDLKGLLVTNEINPVTVAGAQNILGSDPERTIMLIVNLSASEIYVGFTGSVGANFGMILPPNGGFMSMNVTEDYESVTLPIHVYSAAAGNQLYVMTTRRETAIKEE